MDIYYRIWEHSYNLSRRIKISPLENYNARYLMRHTVKRVLTGVCQWAITRHEARIDQYANVKDIG